jgi:hypothetical protein
VETFHFFGAYSAVIGGLAFLASCLGRAPEVADRARDEIRRELGDGQGYNVNSMIYDNTYTLSLTAPTLIQFNYFGVDDLVFLGSGGMDNPGLVGPAGTTFGGHGFVMDNLTVEFIPEPGAGSLMLCGMLWAGWAARRRRAGTAAAPA